MIPHRGRRNLAIAALVKCACCAAAPSPDNPAWVEGRNLRCGVDQMTGLPSRIESRVGRQQRPWLHDGSSLRVRNEATGVTAAPTQAAVKKSVDGLTVEARLAPLGIFVSQQWAGGRSGLTWEMTFRGDGKRTGHEIVLDLPILSPDLSVFTPSDRGAMDMSVYPTFKPVSYAHVGWSGGQAYVLPLVSVFDAKADSALTIALPADADIPDLQVEWVEAKTLRITMGHRGVGGGRPSGLKLLFFAHEADYRAVLKAYSDMFPAYFNPPLPRGPHEGAFWYHHIQAHPDFEEMARQRVRYIWSSFWFTHLGEYLPDEKEWAPFTFAKYWNLRQMMSDDKINAFIKEMHEHGIGTYAYFNVTEYGGAGGKDGDAARAEQILKEKFANALIRNEQGQPIPTWEGAMAMNAGRNYALWPLLQEQVRRHLTRLPACDGFVIDRLDWASCYDYGHHDDLTMVGDRTVENMAQPVGEAVREVCRLTHAAGKRVFVNQFWRLEVLRDVDGSCHESDYLAQRYLIPLRPASAWHQQKRYDGDLLAFEAQLKQRLQIGLFPQMIAHEFPISQQGPNPRAADLLEIYSPLFETLIGRRQVLLPHCVAVTGANDANLFINGAGHYVVPVTSRVRFLSRRTPATEGARVALRVPDAARLTWAQVYSADGPPYRATVVGKRGVAHVTVGHHGTASMVVLGRGAEPAFAHKDADHIAQIRQRLFPREEKPSTAAVQRPVLSRIAQTVIQIKGVPVGAPGIVTVLVDDKEVGKLAGSHGTFALSLSSGELPTSPPAIRLVTGDEGTWFIPERIQWQIGLLDGKRYRVAEWTATQPAKAGRTSREVQFPLAWCPIEEVPESKAQFEAKDTTLGGKWSARFGSRAVWMAAAMGGTDQQNGYRLEVRGGQEYVWADGIQDLRVLDRPKSSPGPLRAACWHDVDEIPFLLTPPDAKPYRLTLYLLDYDHNGREMEVVLSDEMGVQLSAERASKRETDGGVCLTWTVTGAVTVQVRKLVGYNAVVSGVFVDSVR